MEVDALVQVMEVRGKVLDREEERAGQAVQPLSSLASWSDARMWETEGMGCPSRWSPGGRGLLESHSPDMKYCLLYGLLSVNWSPRENCSPFPA